ncbi:hypothetical protein [Aliarcobacter butzleri]|uniref:hypothetical protein n=1 Tax=Aliarcobacter butzleri TaxID=28197 RepID=UPI002B24CBE0|nr:hypothetical protein [Aliarcobacter butzleri]
MASSVVTNNYLKDFDAHVQFGKGIIQGGGEKLWEDLKALGIAISSPIETAKAILGLISSPEAIQTLGTQIVLELQAKSINVMKALFSSEAYEGDRANQAGKDFAELTISILEAYSGVKGVTTGTKAASEVLQASKNTMDKADNLWSLPPTYRGKLIEDNLAKTEYKDWTHVGKQQNGYFPLIDFFNDKTNTATSLKTIDTSTNSWKYTIEEHIQDLGTRGVNMDGVKSNMELDLRVPKGGTSNVEYLKELGKDYNVKVIIKEY